MEIPSSFRLATAEQAKLLDAETIKTTGISGRMLMEVAGAKAAEYIINHTRLPISVLILCGKGNNAGDALVTARYLSQNGYTVIIVFAEGVNNLSPDAKANLEVLEYLKNQSTKKNIILHTDSNAIENLPSYDIIIDGLLGIGMKGEVRAPYDKLIEYANNATKPTYALDIPSGLNADNGKVSGSCIQADYTFSFGIKKLGPLFGDGPARSGKIIYIDLGFPEHLRSDIKCYSIAPEWLDREDIKHKELPSHKYAAGIIYVIAGSEGMTGAAIMAAQSAWKTGVGAVSVIAPGGLVGVFDTHLIHQTKTVVGNSMDVFFKTVHYDKIMEQITRRKGTLIIGPGIGRNAETVQLVTKIIETHEGNIVLDADGLWALSQQVDILEQTKASMILTPHPGELKSLTGSEVNDSFERMNLVTDFCNKQRVHMVSKGNPTIIGTPDRDTYLTQYDTRIFARTGYGDILAGKIAGNWEITGTPVYSCAKALLDGKNRYDAYIENNANTPEPLDLI